MVLEHATATAPLFFLFHCSSPKWGKGRWRLLLTNTFNYKVLCSVAPRAPSSPRICRHPQRGRKLKEGDGISHGADGGWAADRNYPECYSNGTTSLCGQLRTPVLSNELSQRTTMFLSTGHIQTHRCSSHTQWLLNSQVLKDTTSVPTCCCWALETLSSRQRMFLPHLFNLFL